jgi:anhydro-N-acetylmuramic acid kinase
MALSGNYIAKLAAKHKLRVAGLMSGTSADGVAAAIIDIERRKVRLAAFDVFAYPAAIRKAILRLSEPETSGVDEICHYNFVLGEIFAEALIRLCRESGVALRSIDLVGSHGQTIYHNPGGRNYGKRMIRSTLQIGEPCVIAERMGVTTVGDFRPRDIAAGGEGAPLVPYADYILFRHERLRRAIQNIGGIANVTFLPANCREGNIIAFDTGPGNMVIDGVVRLITKGKRLYDRGGEIASQGKVDRRLLGEMMRHPFLLRRPPKSTGREEFGRSYSDWFFRRAKKMGLRASDMTATATAFTAGTIASAYRRFLPAMPDEVVLCGGGAHNGTLIAMLREELDGIKILSTGDFGISVDAKEAVSFAILAWATIKGLANNVPVATGAGRAVVLGKIVPGQ